MFFPHMWPGSLEIGLEEKTKILWHILKLFPSLFRQETQWIFSYIQNEGVVGILQNETLKCGVAQEGVL